MTNGQIALIGGGVAAVGAYLWLRQRSGGGELFGGLSGLPMVRSGAAADGSLYYRMAEPVSGPTFASSGPAGPTVQIANAGPSAGQTLGRVGVGAGTAIGAAALGPGSVLGAAVTAGIGGAVAVLTWAITSRGLFRGGEVGVVINPARDQFLLQFGPGGTGPDSGFGRLAAALSEITGEPNGSHYFQALIGATKKDELIRATQEIQSLLASRGVIIGAFEG